ncbi:MAG: DUF86 domain-containing protein [Candidatus Lokiarchaeota archaeon]|nr:DUF86 domain-containing protein [Candidatus Lokiarchaeota archaeon]
MPKTRSIKLFFMDILEAIENIKLYIKNMEFDDFVVDKKTIDAVVKNLMVIGEASKNLPQIIRIKYPEVNWKGAIGMKDKLVHGYFGISVQIVWETIINDIPNFESQIKEIMKKEVDKQEK